MRKCGLCGSLLLGDGATCTRCGAPLPALATPPPPPVPAGGPPPAPEAPPALREQWQPVAVVAAPASPPRATRLGIIALAVVLVAGVVFGVAHVRSDPLPAGTSAFVSGGGTTYTSPDGGFQVLLPQAPVLDQRTATVDGQTVAVNAAAVTGAKYTIAAVSMVFPSALDAGRVNQVLEGALTSNVSGVSGKIVHRDLTMRGDLPALDAKLDGPGGSRAHLLIVASGATMVMLIVESRTGTDRLFKALADSLIVR